MKTVTVTLKGKSPLLINRFKEQAELTDAIKKSGKKDYGTPREQAEQTAYHDKRTKKIWIPSSWIIGSIMTVASDYKIPGSRKSVKSVAGGVIVPCDEKIYFKGALTLAKIEVDSRPVVIQRARIMRHRARVEKWEVTFSIEIDESILPVDSVHDILSDAGRRAGIGDYRPQKGGPFGRYQITKWTVKR